MPSDGKTIGGLSIRRLRALDPEACALMRDTNVVTVCTIAKDGSVHAQPVWVDTDGEHVVLNSVPGRAWVRNIEREPRVTCTIVNLQNPYEFVEIRGRVVERTTKGAEAHIHFLAKKYLGLDEYPFLSADEPRLLLRVTPERVVHMHPQADELDS